MDDEQIAYAESNGYLGREHTRHSYKEAQLSGTCQSMLPTFRLSSSFGCIEEPDEFGYYKEKDHKVTPARFIEIQSRGFVHEHAKILTVPKSRAARLYRKLFTYSAVLPRFRFPSTVGCIGEQDQFAYYEGKAKKAASGGASAGVAQAVIAMCDEKEQEKC